MAAEIDLDHVAFYEKDRKGIFIHADLLKNSPFLPGDRFSIYPKPAQLFSLTLIKDGRGDIFFDRYGIFIARTRRIDILMGGIFDKYVIYIEPEAPDSLRIRPLDIVLDPSQRWD
jgi:hypothetical protein